MSTDPRTTPESTTQQMRDARARAWAYIFECHARNKGGPATAQDDPKENEDDRDAPRSIQ